MAFDIKVFAIAPSVHIFLAPGNHVISHDSQKDRILLQRLNEAQETFSLKKILKTQSNQNDAAFSSCQVPKVTKAIKIKAQNKTLTVDD